MSTGIWSAASGAVSQSFALDVSANNIANASTPGYRADQAVFRQELTRAVQNIGSDSLRYSVVRSTSPNLGEGQRVATGRGLDVALKDRDAFLVVSTPRGERYTRAGGLELTSDGALVTRDGFPVLGPERKPLRVPADAQDVRIGRQGQLVVDGTETNLRLMSVRFRPEVALEKDGNVLLRGPEGMRPPPLAPVDVEPEALELGNVSAVSSMTGLVTASRQFEMLTRVIEAFSTIDKKAATEVMGRR